MRAFRHLHNSVILSVFTFVLINNVKWNKVSLMWIYDKTHINEPNLKTMWNTALLCQYYGTAIPQHCHCTHSRLPTEELSIIINKLEQISKSWACWQCQLSPWLKIALLLVSACCISVSMCEGKPSVQEYFKSHFLICNLTTCRKKNRRGFRLIRHHPCVGSSVNMSCGSPDSSFQLFWLLSQCDWCLSVPDNKLHLL